jgi:hypothetical protein
MKTASMKERAAFVWNALILTNRFRAKCFGIIKTLSSFELALRGLGQTKHCVLATAAEQFGSGQGFFKEDLVTETTIQNG